MRCANQLVEYPQAICGMSFTFTVNEQLWYTVLVFMHSKAYAIKLLCVFLSFIPVV